MQGRTNSWRATALTLFAAALALVFLLATGANACPEHHAGQNQAHAAVPQSEPLLQEASQTLAMHAGASVAVQDNGDTPVNCMRLRCCGTPVSSTCCATGNVALQRSEEIGVKSDERKHALTLATPITAPVPAAQSLALEAPHLGGHEHIRQIGKSRLVAISHRLRL